MTNQLKPCAFCGCTKVPKRQGNGVGDYWFECFDCGASTRLREDGAGCEKDWNRRPADASIADTAGAIDKDAIAWGVHHTCARISGATFHNAAEMAIDEVLKAIAATPAPSVADDSTVPLETVISEFEAKHGPIPQVSVSSAADAAGVETEPLVAAFDLSNGEYDLYLHPSDELTALRKRIAILERERDEAIAAEEKVQELHDALHERVVGMEKAAERYQFLRERFDECSAELEFGREDLPMGDCWVQVKQNIGQGKALDETIDAAIAKEPPHASNQSR